MTDFYADHSEVVIDDRDSAMAAQQALTDLGFDLGTVDGVWGPMSMEAAQQWQEINGYENANGEITARQLDVLGHQSAHPGAYEMQLGSYRAEQLQPFFESFDTSRLDHLDPVRAAILTQHAAHLGVSEPIDPETYEGTNTGPAVRQYLESDPRAFEGNAWCASYGSWVLDQIEGYAGLEPNEFMEGNMRVHEVADQIRTDSPQAVKSFAEYEPQGGDLILYLNDGGTGHFATAVASFEAGENVTNVITIDGNSQDGVNLSQAIVYTDPETGTSYSAYIDAEGYITPDYTTEIITVDISELPNYGSLHDAFERSAAPYMPTTSADPGFEHDFQQIGLLSEVLDTYRATIQPEVILPDFYNGQSAATVAENTTGDYETSAQRPIVPTF